MALTPSLARRALAVGAAATVALVALAVPASAHRGKPVASCDKETGKTTLTVNLADYNPNKQGDESKAPNTIKITDGDQVLLALTHFGGKYPRPDTDDKGSFELPGDVDHNFTVVVTAWDDEDLKDDEWSFTWKKKVEACVEKEQPPSSVSSPPSSPSNPPSSAPTTTTTAPAVVASTALADTGASIGLPLAIGALLLIGGVGMLILVRRRRKI